VLALLALSRGGATAQTVTAAPLARGEISFAMQASIVNDFVGRVPVARAEFTGSDVREVRGFVEVRVADMRTGIDLRDRHLRETMRADSLPTIRFDLDGVEPGQRTGDTVAVTFRGSLTIRGQTRPARFSGWLVIHGAGATVQAAAPIDMREYGITPPTRSLGLVRIRVAPVTQVTARLWFGEERRER
jgi:polyisoprenoid-binding protein YceI